MTGSVLDCGLCRLPIACSLLCSPACFLGFVDVPVSCVCSRANGLHLGQWEDMGLLALLNVSVIRGDIAPWGQVTNLPTVLVVLELIMQVSCQLPYATAKLNVDRPDSCGGAFGTFDMSMTYI